MGMPASLIATVMAVPRPPNAPVNRACPFFMIISFKKRLSRLYGKRGLSYPLIKEGLAVGINFYFKFDAKSMYGFLWFKSKHSLREVSISIYYLVVFKDGYCCRILGEESIV